MQGLTVKDVEFNGATLRAAQVENIVYVGVRCVCAKDLVLMMGR